MSQSIEDFVKAGLRAFEEQDKIPPAERFDRLVRAGIIDQQGRLLHQEGDDEQVPISQLLLEQAPRP